MKRLIELAEKIKDKSLREKTIKMLKETPLTNPELKLPRAKLDEIPSWVGAHHYYKGGLADHIYSVTKSSIELAKIYEKTYKAKINFDYLISGSLLHDIMKVYLIKKSEKGWAFTGCNLDHAQLSAAELYAQGFPQEVIHIAAAHGGDQGAAAAAPRTIEATIVFYCDVIDSAVEGMIHGVPNPLQFLLMGAEE